MRYSPNPPYELLENKLLDFTTMQRLSRFSRYWDVVANSGNFTSTATLLWGDGSPFAGFFAFADWLYAKTASRSGFSVKNMASLLYQYLGEERGVSQESAAESILADFTRCGRTDIPRELDQYVKSRTVARSVSADLPSRQARHTVR